MTLVWRLLAYLLCIINLQSDGKFYIYDDWPPELEDVWPAYDAKLHKDSGYSHEFRGNNGAGTLLDAQLGMYQTWQFALFRLVMNRLKHSDRRTYNPMEASAFIIPFDLGVHSHIDHIDGRMRLASPHGWTAIRLLEAIQKDTTGFWRNHGHDHFVIFGITAYQMVGIGVKVFFMGACKNCSVLTIETSPTHTAIPGRSNKYWFAQPYPSFFHAHEGMKSFPWEINPSLTRDILALFIGSIHTKNARSNLLRRKLSAQCGGSDLCVWRKTPHSCYGTINETAALKMFLRSK